MSPCSTLNSWKKQCCDTEVKLPFCEEEEVMKLNLVIPSYPSEPREQRASIVQHYAWVSTENIYQCHLRRQCLCASNEPRTHQSYLLCFLLNGILPASPLNKPVNTQQAFQPTYQRENHTAGPVNMHILHIYIYYRQSRCHWEWMWCHPVCFRPSKLQCSLGWWGCATSVHYQLSAVTATFLFPAIYKN